MTQASLYKKNIKVGYISRADFKRHMPSGLEDVGASALTPPDSLFAPSEHTHRAQHLPSTPITDNLFMGQRVKDAYRIEPSGRILRKTHYMDKSLAFDTEKRKLHAHLHLKSSNGTKLQTYFKIRQ